MVGAVRFELSSDSLIFTRKPTISEGISNFRDYTQNVYVTQDESENVSAVRNCEEFAVYLPAQVCNRHFEPDF
jgi:hypothetical protein